MTTALIALIHTYQLITRPLAALRIGPFAYAGCRQWPTCSEYGITALREHGPWYGSWMTFVRILTCNPFTA